MDNSIGKQRTIGADGRTPVSSAGASGRVSDCSVGDRLTVPGRADPSSPDRSLGDARTMRPGGTSSPEGRFGVGDVILGRYRVTDELGQGGMGVVYRCFDETAGIDVALKALPPEVAHNSGEMEEVRENFRLVSKLHHPNIANVNTLEKDPATGDYYLVMECVDGLDLRQWARKRRGEGRPLNVDEVRILAYRIASALDYAHEQKVIHRDIKPSNVRVTFDGDVKVLDFGLAAQLHTSLSRLSQAYRGTSGTGPYMAPEQWRGKRQGAAADQYALAATVYELLSGVPPFENHDPAVLREAVLKEPPPPLEGVSQHVNAALMKALSKEPEGRFATCGEFVAALSGKKAHAETQRPKAKRALLWLVGAAALAVAGVVGYGTRTPNAERSTINVEVLAKAAAEQAAAAVAANLAKAKEAAEQAAKDEAARLAKEKMSGPSEGAPWTSPATEMEFVWVPVLKLWVGKYEVTNDEYRKQTPDHDSKDYQGHTLNCERQPVVYVNFDDAKAYAAWLTERDRDQLDGLRYRMIAEVEWQACAQCGDGREYPWGNAMPPKRGNYSDSASAWGGKIDGYTDGFAVTCPVERSGANEWGIYGLGGNVWECCASDAAGSSFSAWRGASWVNDDPDSFRCVYRGGYYGSYRNDIYGFRLVLSR